ncbi:MAG: DivIVA domain-containing protein [bacterium]
MSELTPNDIVNKEFKKSLSGYNVQEVDDFMQICSDALFHAIEEKIRQQAVIDELQKQVENNRRQEDFIKSALILAEKTADETRMSARKDAELQRREIEIELQRERTELAALKQKQCAMLAEVRAALYSQLALLESQEKKFTPPENAG